MRIREVTQDDLDRVSKVSVSRGPKEYTQTVDFGYAVEHGEDLLGVGGLKLLNATTAWCWMDWTPAGLEHKYVAYRTVKEFLDALVDRMKIIRLMAAIEPDFDEAIRTVEHLGFKREHTMPCFFGDKPAILYARLTGGED